METSDYRRGLYNYISSAEFGQLDDNNKQKNLDLFRQEFISKNPQIDVDAVNSITEEENKMFLRATGRGRAIPEINIIFPNQEEGFKDLTQEERQEKIEEFKLKIPEIAKANPTQREDTEFFLNQSVRQLERINNGEDRGWVRDKASRVAQGFVAGLSRYVGAESFAETAEDYFFENPKFDEDFSSHLAQGLGDMGASMTIFMGSMLATRGVGSALGKTASSAVQANVATGVGLTSNSIMRYNQAYKEAINKGLAEEDAFDAGLSAIPAAAIDVLGDRLIASKLMPKKVNDVFATGTQAEKKLAFKELFSQQATKQKVLGIGVSALSEGATEAVGDFVAGYMPYIETGEYDFVPKDKELALSFAVGAVLGGGIAGAGEAAPIFGNNKANKLIPQEANADGTMPELPKYDNRDEKFVGETERAMEFLEPETQTKVYEALAKEDIKEAYRIAEMSINKAYGRFQQGKTKAGEAKTTPTQQPKVKAAEPELYDPNEVAPPAQQADPNAVSDTNTTPAVATSAPAINSRSTSVFDNPAEAPESLPQGIAAGIPFKFGSILAPFKIGKITSRAVPINVGTQGKVMQAAVVDYGGRKIVKMNIGGVVVPFYNSSGKAPKKGVEPGKWYPFFGLDKSKGWLNKSSSSEMSAYYGSAELKAVAENLDSTIGDVRGRADIMNIGDSNEETIDLINEGLSPVANDRKNAAQVKNNINSVLSRIEQAKAAAKAEPKQADTENKKAAAKRKADIENKYKAGTTIQPDTVVEQEEETETAAPADRAVSVIDQANASPKQVYRVANHFITEKIQGIVSQIHEMQNRYKKPTKGIEKLQRRLAAYRRLSDDIATKNPTAKVWVVDDLGAEGFYHGDSNTIVIRAKYADSDRVIMHEFTHALTQADIRTFVDSRKEEKYMDKLKGALVNSKTPVHIKTLIDVYINAASKLKKKDIIGMTSSNVTLQSLSELGVDYSFVDLHEFVANAMSTEEFQNILSNIPYKGTTLWKTIVDAISKAFEWMGLVASPELVMRSKNMNSLSATLAAVNKIINTRPVQAAGVSMSPENNINSKEDAIKSYEAFQQDRNTIEQALNSDEKLSSTFLNIQLSPQIYNLGTKQQIEFFEKHLRNRAGEKAKTIGDVEAAIREYLTKTKDGGYENLFPEPNEEKIHAHYKRIIKDPTAEEAADFPADWLQARKLSDDQFRSMFVGERLKKITQERANAIKSTAEYLLSEMHNGTYAPAFVAQMLDQVSGSSYSARKNEQTGEININFQSITNGNEAVPNPVDAQIMARANSKTLEGKSSKVSYKEAVTEILTQRLQENTQTKRGWHRYVKSNKEEDASELYKDASVTNWCTGGSVGTAQSHLSGGDFYIYFNENGTPKAAIRTLNGKIKEVRGTLKSPFQGIESEELDLEIQQFIESSPYVSGGEAYFHDRDFRRAATKYNNTGELNDILLSGFGLNGKWVGDNAKMEYGNNFADEFIGKLKQITLTQDQIFDYNEDGEIEVVKVSVLNTEADYFTQIEELIEWQDINAKRSENNKFRFKPSIKKIKGSFSAPNPKFASDLNINFDVEGELVILDDRIGVDGEWIYNNVKSYTEYTSQKLSDILKAFPNLEEISSAKITSIEELEMLQQLKKVETIDIDIQDSNLKEYNIDLGNIEHVSRIYTYATKADVLSIVGKKVKTFLSDDYIGTFRAANLIDLPLAEVVNADIEVGPLGSIIVDSLKKSSHLKAGHIHAPMLESSDSISIYYDIANYKDSNLQSLKNAKRINMTSAVEAIRNGLEFYRRQKLNLQSLQSVKELYIADSFINAPLLESMDKLSMYRGILHAEALKNISKLAWRFVDYEVEYNLPSIESFYPEENIRFKSGNHILKKKLSNFDVSIYNQSNGSLNITYVDPEPEQFTPLTPEEIGNIQLSPERIANRKAELDAKFAALIQQDMTEESSDMIDAINIEAAELAGFDTKNPMFRADTSDWAIPYNQPYYVGELEIAKLYFEAEQGSVLRPFFIKKDLKLAKEGEMINGRPLKTSSFLHAGDLFAKLKNSHTATELRRFGYDGAIGGVYGAEQFQEVVVFDPRNMKRADAIIKDIYGDPILPSQRYDTTKNNINYSPEQTKAKQDEILYKRLREIQKGNLNDKVDVRTTEIIGALRKIKPRDVDKLSPEMKIYFAALVDNIYEARKNALENPGIRLDSDIMLQEINSIQEVIDASVIEDMILKYDDLMDFSEVDMKDPSAVKKAINEWHENLNTETFIAKQIRKQAAADRLEAIYEEYRNVGSEMQDIALQRYADSENFVAEQEALRGSKVNSEGLREFTKAHFDYLTTIDFAKLEGMELYKHFYAINNILDNNFAYMQLTAKHIARVMNENADLDRLAGSFRDPVLARNQILQALDKFNQYAELQQVQMQRFSSYQDSVKFLKEDLFGGLMHAIVTTSYNRKREMQDAWEQRVKDFEETLGRPMNQEDMLIISIVGRLVQFESGATPDKELHKNIKKERESINNILKRKSVKDISIYQEKALPLLDMITSGITESYTMNEFMETIVDRMSGTESANVGLERKNILNSLQEMFAQFDMESEIISEGLHGTAFKRQVHYVPSQTHTTNSHNHDNSEATLESPILELDGETKFKSGLKSKAGHYNERQAGLGDDRYYAYNPNYIASRGFEIMSVDAETIHERFIISERLKKGTYLNSIIAMDENGYHEDRIDQLTGLAKKIVTNAFSRGEPLNILVSGMRSLANMYARPTLSSPHHVVTQPLAAFVDYGVRTKDYSGWMQALLYYIKNVSSMDQFFEDNSRWTSDRGAIETQSLDYRKSPNESKLGDTPAMRFLNKFYDGASDLITIFLRTGDNVSSRVTILAEYVRRLKEKGYPVKSIDDVDFTVVEGRELSFATMESEKIINTSNKILRGELYSDRRQLGSVLRNVFFAFSSHSGMLATQMNQTVRDLFELKSMGASREEIEPKIRTIGAILSQSFIFTSARFVIGALLTKNLIQMIFAFFDDDDETIEKIEKKIQIAKENGDSEKADHLELDLKYAQSVKNIVEKMRHRTTSPTSWYKQIVRDTLGVSYIGFNNGVFSQAAFLVPDILGGKMYKETQDEIVQNYKERILKAREQDNDALVSKLSKEMAAIEATEYIPYAYKDLSGLGVGGIYGSTLGVIQRSVMETTQGLAGLQEYNWNDFVMSMNVVGIGQAEANKFLSAVDQIEDRNWKSNQEFQERKAKEAKAKAAKENSKDAEVFDPFR